MAIEAISNRCIPFLLVVVCLAGLSGVVRAAEEDESIATIAPVSQRSDFFGEQQATLSFQCVSEKPVQGKILWQYSAGARTLARGEDAIELAAGRPNVFELPIEFPPVREGVIFETQMVVTIIDGDNETLAQYTHPIWLFPKDPYTDRREWLEQLDIHLYDPEDTTAKLLEEAKIPHTRITNSNVLADFEGGILLVGSGTSLRKNRGLTDSLITMAERGVRVLCLAPVDGEFPWPTREEFPQLANVQFSSNEVIRDLDKRLNPDFDVLAEQRFGVVLESRRGQLRVNLSEARAAWPWWQVRFTNHGTCILCCFDMIPTWDTSPTPRFLLANLLEKLSLESHSSPTEQ
ncbi:hypothetical protein Pan97_38280 [Bremerella volcania]|uniref:Uncharacterized protein n=1 Tax=Bremerella volcania TaxID=2527984 RepID=A0A518CC18_9BACT|nr:hypothetical protein [Bremerella volcania]QDU76771.1 hypothetical protein Pan97_38280 [Bremerella volcania]